MIISDQGREFVNQVYIDLLKYNYVIDLLNLLHFSTGFNKAFTICIAKLPVEFTMHLAEENPKASSDRDSEEKDGE